METSGLQKDGATAQGDPRLATVGGVQQQRRLRRGGERRRAAVRATGDHGEQPASPADLHHLRPPTQSA
jgi:hypothetical protein